MNNFKKKTLTILALLLVVACGGSKNGEKSTSNTTPVAANNTNNSSNTVSKVTSVDSTKNPNLVNNIQYSNTDYDSFNNRTISRSGTYHSYIRVLPTQGRLENNRFNRQEQINWNSSERIYNANNPDNKPYDTSYKGNGVKLGITDGGFNNETNWNNARSLAKNIERLGTSNNLSASTHGVDVLATAILNAPDADYVVLDSSSGPTGINANERYYKRMLDDGVRIFNNSFGNVETHNNPRSVLGSDVYDILKEGVNKGALFVWSGGNIQISDISGKNGNLPRLDSSLEKGWLNVVGLVPKNFSNNFNFDNLIPLSPAGSSKYWSLSALGYVDRGNGDIEYGSSFAAPRVSSAAVVVKSKFSFMNGDLLRQTILSTATDIGDPGVDDIYGWGLLDLEKALRGPALFDRRLALGEQVNIQLDGGSYSFDNDISGDAGLNLAGKGTLTLNGKTTYTGETTIGSEAHLKIRKVTGSRILLNKGAKLEMQNASVPEIISDGTIINVGNSQVGNLTLNNTSELLTDINGIVTTNNAQLGGKVTITNYTNEYLTKNGKNIDIITGNVTGNAEIKTSSELLDAKSEVSSVGVQATVSRKDVMGYAISKNSTEQQVNTAEQIETTLTHLDSLVENGIASKETLSNAAQLQSLNSTTLDTMSGQIYASAQALTFEQSEVVNRDLSNRMSDLARSLGNDNKFGFWTSGIFSKGKIEKDGFAKGRTEIKGGQVGFDIKLNKNTIVGISADYSKGKVKFDRYNGKSKADLTGISVYGRQNIGNSYIAGRLGFGYADTDVERDIIVNSNIFEHSKVNHKDKSISGYFEGGYDIKNKNGDFVFTPYAALGTDNVTRGKFSEENTNFGMKADKKSYNLPYATVGGKIAKTFGKIDFTGYAGYTHGLNKKDLNFDASYNFSPEAKFTVKGINYSRNKINAGIGVNAEVKEGISWYSNYDFKHSTDKSKANNHMVTTGVRFEF